MRSTISQVPSHADLASNAGMPLALVVSPLALPHPRDDQIQVRGEGRRVCLGSTSRAGLLQPPPLPLQVVDMGELGPVRCARCKAYMNPFMRFMASGRCFTCNFCGHSNTTPEAYFCHLGHDGRRCGGGGGQGAAEARRYEALAPEG